MKKPALTCMALIFACTVQFANAQTGVNKISITNSDNGESALNSPVDGISFTPDGILRTTESGGTKSIKNLAAPVVTKEKETPVIEEKTSLESFSPLQFKYAMMLDVNVESLKNISLLAFIDDWFGTRYRFGGTTKRGIDCSALTSALLLAVYGFNMPRTAREQYEATEHIGRDELKEGDLVFFNTRGGVSHVGIYLDNDRFLQASSHGVTISCLDDHYYKKRFICGGRVSQDKMSDIN